MTGVGRRRRERRCVHRALQSRGRGVRRRLENSCPRELHVRVKTMPFVRPVRRMSEIAVRLPLRQGESAYKRDHAEAAQVLRWIHWANYRGRPVELVLNHIDCCEDGNKRLDLMQRRGSAQRWVSILGRYRGSPLYGLCRLLSPDQWRGHGGRRNHWEPGLRCEPGCEFDRRVRDWHGNSNCRDGLSAGRRDISRCRWW